MDRHAARAFNNEKHARGDWDTRVLVTASRPLRFCAGFLSHKRKGVDELAKALSKSTGMVLDAGAGTGAYSLWFASREPGSNRRIVSVDLSFTALKKAVGIAAAKSRDGRISAVCADLSALPFREQRFCGAFSVDTLGHVADVNKVLDELFRCSVDGAPMFLHSECADYRSRWPDRMLIGRLGQDVPARQDGHGSLLDSRALFTLYSRRFRVISFVNPAGYLGWFLGYPEKYAPAFAQAGMTGVARLLCICATLKKAPVIGVAMRVCNAISNHCENYFGLTGGGSCFALVKKPT